MVALMYGNIFLNERQPEKAVLEYKKAIALKPDYAQAHYAIGYIQSMRGDRAAAANAFRKAIECKPDYAEAHNALVDAIAGRERDWRLAIAEYRARIKREDGNAGNQFGLGIALLANDEADASAKAFQHAIALSPKFALAYSGLGSALKMKAETLDSAAATALLDEAIAEHKKAIALTPGHPLTHYRLGEALARKGDFAAAVDEYRDAIRLKPTFVEAHRELGACLKRQGKFADAAKTLRRAQELASSQIVSQETKSDLNEKLQAVSCLSELQSRLPALLRGTDNTLSNPQRLILIDYCNEELWNAAAVRLWLAAFSSDPSLSQDISQHRRYNAACAAVLAGTGQAKDDPPPDAVQKSSFRKQALDWLQADLESWGKSLESDRTEERATALDSLQYMMTDADFSAVRESAALDQLPADEQAAWRSFWSRAGTLLKAAKADPNRHAFETGSGRNR